MQVQRQYAARGRVQETYEHNERATSGTVPCSVSSNEKDLFIIKSSSNYHNVFPEKFTSLTVSSLAIFSLPLRSIAMFTQNKKRISKRTQSKDEMKRDRRMLDRSSNNMLREDVCGQRASATKEQRVAEHRARRAWVK